jgi:hypothetical protein
VPFGVANALTNAIALKGRVFLLWDDYDGTIDVRPRAGSQGQRPWLGSSFLQRPAALTDGPSVGTMNLRYRAGRYALQVDHGSKSDLPMSINC